MLQAESDLTTFAPMPAPSPHAAATRVEMLSKLEQLEHVRALYRKGVKTLGFLPDGAFDEHARKKQILIAIDGEACVGYLLYRVAKERAAIVHLCTSPSHRGRGIAKSLMNRLIAETKHLRGIGLYCRRDYDANKMWPKLGFTARWTKAGRGYQPAELTFWWLDHNHPDLFSAAACEAPTEALPVTIDANVFFDLHERTTDESRDSKALLDPWLQEVIELCLTPEIYNDIDRAPDKPQRQQSLRNVGKHRVLPTDSLAVQTIIENLAKLLSPTGSLRDESDVRHLAHSIVAGVSYFVTRDQKLIEASEQIYSKFGLSVVHPARLINQLDSIQRETEYRPARLAGSQIRDCLLTTESLQRVAEAFRCIQGEKRSELEKTLQHYLVKPKEFECRVSSAQDGNPLVLSVIRPEQCGNLEVCLLRSAANNLAPTVARHVLRALLETRAQEKLSMIRISESRLSPALFAALQELGFVQDGNMWLKLSAGGLVSSASLRSGVRQLATAASPELLRRIDGALAEFDTGGNRVNVSKLEQVFWPAKLAQAAIPTYIVPIQPRWAQHFFDAELGSQMLIGLRTELHLGIEGVYYRSVHGPAISAPARIFWYVSQGADKDGAMAIKACSRLEEVVIGTARELYRRFRRLGVYEWRDVLAAADGNPDGELMALRFTLTERFQNPVGLAWLADQELKGPFLSPRKITPDQFTTVYREGCKLP